MSDFISMWNPATNETSSDVHRAAIRDHEKVGWLRLDRPSEMVGPGSRDVILVAATDFMAKWNAGFRLARPTAGVIEIR